VNKSRLGCSVITWFIVAVCPSVTVVVNLLWNINKIGGDISTGAGVQRSKVFLLSYRKLWKAPPHLEERMRGLGSFY